MATCNDPRAVVDLGALAAVPPGNPEGKPQVDHTADLNGFLMSCYGLMQGGSTGSREELRMCLAIHHTCDTPGPSAEQLLATEPHSYSPHIESPWGLAPTAGMKSVGGCSYGHILQPRSLALALPYREGPRPAAFQVLALAQTPATPGSCTCSHTGPGNAGAVGIDSFLLPLHMTQGTALWSPGLLKGRRSYLPSRGGGGLQ